MSAISEPGRQSRTIINNQEPVAKAPPIPVSGPIAWMRENLFKTVFDSILTVVGGLLLSAALFSMLRWAVVDANWFVITRNLRLFMTGSMQSEDLLRVQIITVIVVVLCGVTLATFVRLGRRAILMGAVIVALIAILPPIIQATIPLPPTYFLAGNVQVVSGTLTETPIDDVAFIAPSDTTIRVGLAQDEISTESSLTRFAGFTDRATDAIVNAARARQTALARIEEISLQLEGNLSDSTRAALESELTTLQAQVGEDTINSRYALNDLPVNVQIINGADNSILGETALTPGSEPLTVKVPEAGWYVLRKSVEGEGTAVLLEAEGIYPLQDRPVVRPLFADDGTPLLSPTGLQRTETITQYLQVTSEFITEAIPPRIDGQNVPTLHLSDQQYRGQRPPRDFLVLHVGPFFQRLSYALVPLSVVFLLGYMFGTMLDRLRPTDDPRARWSLRLTLWGWGLLPLIIFFLVIGTDVGRWGGLFLTFMLTAVGIVASFPIGILLALGRRATDLPAISIASTIYIEFVRGVPLITVLFIGSLALPLVDPNLNTIPGAVRAMVAITAFSAAYLAENVRGGLQAIPPGQIEAAKALGMGAWQVTLFITLPQALRLVIPALVGQFISLFKDTSLVAIVGLADLLNTGRSAVTQGEFLGLQREVYLFIAVVYFVFSYVMSAVARRLEASGSGRVRRTIH